MSDEFQRNVRALEKKHRAQSHAHRAREIAAFIRALVLLSLIFALIVTAASTCDAPPSIAPANDVTPLE